MASTKKSKDKVRRGRSSWNLNNPADMERFYDYMNNLSDISLSDESGDEVEDIGQRNCFQAELSEVEDAVLETNDEVTAGSSATTLFDEGLADEHQVAQAKYSFTPIKKVVWKQEVEKFEELPCFFKPEVESVPPEVESPITYLSKYLDDSIFEKMVEMTNIYAIQKNSNMKPVSQSEITTCVGLHIAMGVFNIPRVRMYWSSMLKIGLFETMTRDRFFQIRNNIHIVNNLEIPQDNKDRFFKVRPIYDQIRSRCRTLTKEESLSIDEQIVPFTGKLNVKQYVKGKPNPWGIKISVLCGKSGIIHDFFIYQGSTTEFCPEALKVVGVGGATILKLVEDVGPNHKVFFDNYFNSYKILQILRERGIYAAGTVRADRFGKPEMFPTDKEMVKKPRGSSAEITSHDGIVLVKWMDNKVVRVMSNFVGVKKEVEVERFSKKDKAKVQIKCPSVITLYNKSMGGVDLIDQLLSYYRINIKTRKWTIKMLFHAVDVAVCNSWLEYRKHATELKVAKKNQLDLMAFRMQIAEALIMSGKPSSAKKRGRPSTSSPSIITPPQKRKKLEFVPAGEIRFDQIGHFPAYDEKKEASRCKNCTKGKSHYYCIKCKVHLCCSKGKMCFTSFHNKN